MSSCLPAHLANTDLLHSCLHATNHSFPLYTPLLLLDVGGLKDRKPLDLSNMFSNESTVSTPPPPWILFKFIYFCFTVESTRNLFRYRLIADVHFRRKPKKTWCNATFCVKDIWPWDGGSPPIENHLPFNQLFNSLKDWFFILTKPHYRGPFLRN